MNVQAVAVELVHEHARVGFAQHQRQIGAPGKDAAPRRPFVCRALRREVARRIDVAGLRIGRRRVQRHDDGLARILAQRVRRPVAARPAPHAGERRWRNHEQRARRLRVLRRTADIGRERGEQILRRRAVDRDDLRAHEIGMRLGRTHDEQPFGEPVETNRHAIQPSQSPAHGRVPVVGQRDEPRYFHLELRRRQLAGARDQFRPLLLEAARGVGREAAIEREQLRKNVEVLPRRLRAVGGCGQLRDDRHRIEAPVERLQCAPAERGKRRAAADHRDCNALDPATVRRHPMFPFRCKSV